VGHGPLPFGFSRKYSTLLDGSSGWGIERVWALAILCPEHAINPPNINNISRKDVFIVSRAFRPDSKLSRNSIRVLSRAFAANSSGDGRP
jgi:hypothetical protein